MSIHLFGIVVNYIQTIISVTNLLLVFVMGPGWLNELGSWIT